MDWREGDCEAGDSNGRHILRMVAWRFVEVHCSEGLLTGIKAAGWIGVKAIVMMGMWLATEAPGDWWTGLVRCAVASIWSCWEA